MTDAQSALAQVREALEAMRGDWLGDGFTKLRRSQIVAVLDKQEAENEQLREMLAHLYAGSALYCDDGELQDSRASPFIDFKRDSVADIRCAMVERGEQR